MKVSLYIYNIHVSIYHELKKPCTYTKDKLMPQTKNGSPCPKVSSSFSVAHANCETTRQHVHYPFKIRLQNLPNTIHVGVCSIWFVSAIVFISNAECSIAVDTVSETLEEKLFDTKMNCFVRNNLLYPKVAISWTLFRSSI